MVAVVVEDPGAGSDTPVGAMAAEETGDAGEPIADALFAVVDVETSGLNPRRHRVLQVAVVTARADGEVLDRWSSYLRPRRRWLFRRGPVRIHRIGRAALRAAPPAGEVIAEFTRRIDGKVLTAHNLRFDRSFLQAAVGRAGARWTTADELCTLQLSRSLDPERTYSHGLAGLCSRYGVPLDHHHDALADAEATAGLLPHLLTAADVRGTAALARFAGR